jgi:hypothetical protein
MGYLRTIIKKASSIIGARRGINFIDGTGITITVVDDPANDEVDVTIDSAGGTASWGTITGTLSSQVDLQSALDAKQDTLVSATNIKTINGTTILGSGDLTVSGSGLAQYQVRQLIRR